MDKVEGTADKTRRNPGPKPKAKTQQYALMLEPEPADWAKGQPGGLSEFVRRLLREAYKREQQERDKDG